jgi:DNA-binding MarR family transcriptional regulator
MTHPDADAIAAIELQTAVLVRNLELLRRRARPSQELDRASYLLLRTLAALGPSDIGTLAAALGLDPSTVGRQVAAAEEQALLARTPGPDDRRRTVVAATDDGLRRMRLTTRGRRRRTAELLADWDQVDLRRLGTMFSRYNQAVAGHYLSRPEAPATQQPRADEGNP